jgi:hypothetical protein
VASDLPSRVRQLEDRVQIRKQVIRYAIGAGRRDWAMSAGCLTDPGYAGFSAGGIPAATLARTDLVARVPAALSGFTATRHISPNHVTGFGASDPGRAACYSCTYAQHLLRGSANAEFCLLPGSCANHLRRTADGWRIERIIQHRGWEYGNTSAVAEAIAAPRRSHQPASR